MSQSVYRQGIPDDLLKALGLFVMQYSQLEMELQRAIWELTGLFGTENGRILTSRLGERQLREVTLALAHERFGTGQQEKELGDIMRKIENITNRRNDFLHHLWTAYPDPNKAGQLIVKSGAKLRKEQVSRNAKEVGQLADDAYTVMCELAGWLHRHVRPIHLPP
jgi:hypothetical protein